MSGVALVAAAAVSLLLVGGEGLPPGAIRWTPDQAHWRPAPPGSGGAEIWVLEGDPTKAAPFTMRMKVPKGFFLGRHAHPRPERVTVLEGSVQVGFGPDYERKATRLEAGSFYVNPPGVVHIVGSDTGAVLQLTTDGPWEVQRSATGP